MECQQLLLGQFHVYWAACEKPTDETHRLRFILNSHARLYNCGKYIPFFSFLYTLGDIFWFLLKLWNFTLLPHPLVLLLAICGVQHRVLPQAVPLSAFPSVCSWWQVTSLVSSDSKSTCHFNCGWHFLREAKNISAVSWITQTLSTSNCSILTPQWVCVVSGYVNGTWMCTLQPLFMLRQCGQNHCITAEVI